MNDNGRQEAERRIRCRGNERKFRNAEIATDGNNKFTQIPSGPENSSRQQEMIYTASLRRPPMDNYHYTKHRIECDAEHKAQ